MASRPCAAMHIHDLQACEAATRHRYGVYGLAITSDRPMPLPAYSVAPIGRVECCVAPRSAFPAPSDDHAAPADGWFSHSVLDDGSRHVRWHSIGEFIVTPDGARILCQKADGASLESFHVYMLGQALSFALVQQGVEPFHAKEVVAHGEAVAFFGRHAFGKSTLAASFLSAGFPLLTDDLLVVQPEDGRLLAFPGPPRLKLFPGMVDQFFAGDASGVVMNADTRKLIMPLDPRRACDHPVRLRAAYCLDSPGEGSRSSEIAIEPLEPGDAFVELVRGTFNRLVLGRDRLERQFRAAAEIADLLPMKRIRYPRVVNRLDEVRLRLLEDLSTT